MTVPEILAIVTPVSGAIGVGLGSLARAVAVHGAALVKGVADFRNAIDKLSDRVERVESVLSGVVTVPVPATLGTRDPAGVDL